LPNERTAVVLDRFPLWLDAVEQVLRRVGIQVIGKFTEPETALELIEARQPEVLVAEVEDEKGVDVLRRACQRAPSLKAIALSRVDEVEHVDATFAAGAVAYVLKTADPEDLAVAVRQTFGQSVYFPGGRSLASVPVYTDEQSPRLTPREREILALVAQGYSNAQLARALWVTEQTVKFHLSNIYRKLEVANRTEASRWAHLNGLAPSVSVGPTTEAA
jgi:DNA-binding NarL/FixJ family response regulator